MTTPQAGIFHEGTQFHWFLDFRVRPDAPGNTVRADIRAGACYFAPPSDALARIVETAQ